MKIAKILTHIHPDLDAIFSIYLMREHGEEKLPGISSAGFEFVSANNLPDGKSAEELEKEGVIALDTGGGRFDNHPIEGESNEAKWDKCASQLVAEELGVVDEKAYRFLLPYTIAHDSQGQAMTSKEASHHLLAPHGLIDGLHRNAEDDVLVVEQMLILLKGIARASIHDEISTQDVANIFDRTLASYLNENDLPDVEYFRKEAIEWPETGECHVAARLKGASLRRDLEKLLKISSWLLASQPNALPEVEQEKRVILPVALLGLAEEFGEGSEEYKNAVYPILKAAIQREADWFQAIDEVERSAKIVRGRGVSMAAIASKNGLSIKAARYRRGVSAVLYMEPVSKNVTLQSGQRNDGRPVLNLERIAKRLRSAEAIRRRGNGKRLEKNLGEVGMVEGWFLHPSLRLLNRGSPKAPDVEPSALSWKEIIEVIRGDFRPDEKLSEWLCPEDKCTEKECSLFPLRFINCHLFRERIKSTPQRGTLGELFADKLKKK